MPQYRRVHIGKKVYIVCTYVPWPLNVFPQVRVRSMSPLKHVRMCVSVCGSDIEVAFLTRNISFSSLELYPVLSTPQDPVLCTNMSIRTWSSPPFGSIPKGSRCLRERVVWMYTKCTSRSTSIYAEATRVCAHAVSMFRLYLEANSSVVSQCDK